MFRHEIELVHVLQVVQLHIEARQAHRLVHLEPFRNLGSGPDKTVPVRSAANSTPLAAARRRASASPCPTPGAAETE
jgi:hypothetical protein